jgi:hypothetical protein
LEIFINDRFQLLPQNVDILTKVINFESLIFETVSVGSVMELVLPQIQEAILDQKAGSYRNVAPTQSWGFETSVLFSSLCTAFWTSGLTPTEKRRKRWGPYSHSFQCALRIGDIHEAIVPHNNCS